MNQGTTINLDSAVSIDDGRAEPGVVLLHTPAQVEGEGLFAAEREQVVGRGARCSIFVEDPAMSREHMSLAFDGDRAVLRDLGSQNGTFINGRRIDSPREVACCDRLVIRCGQTVLLLVDDLRDFVGWRRGREGPLVGGPAIRRLIAEIDAIAGEQLEVLISGESGTGKELVAEEIHRRSGRSGQFVAVNCAAVPEPLFEAELFGTRKGAFTHATTNREGLFRLAHGGTLFLDEIGETPAVLQAKLLRAVELREVRAIGASQTTRVDVRVIAATNRDLAQLVADGGFREDLYHRLRGYAVRTPPLRERIEDVVLLTEHFRSQQPNALVISVEALERLLIHGWPGNVRELSRSVGEAFLRARAERSDCVLASHLREELRGEPPAPVAPKSSTTVSVDAVCEALKQAGGNVSRAAGKLGIHRTRVYAILRDRGLRPDDFR